MPLGVKADGHRSGPGGHVRHRDEQQHEAAGHIRRRIAHAAGEGCRHWHPASLMNRNLLEIRLRDEPRSWMFGPPKDARIIDAVFDDATEAAGLVGGRSNCDREGELCSTGRHLPSHDATLNAEKLRHRRNEADEWMSRRLCAAISEPGQLEVCLRAG